MIQNKKYFDYYEENKVITQEHINELNYENQKIKEELYKLKEEFKESKLKESKLNEYLEEKK